MSFLIHQNELNDCGPAICAMVLNHFESGWSLAKFKVVHHYDHQQYSFDKIHQILTKHGIKVSSYEFLDLTELRTVKDLVCFRIIRSTGQGHFCLGRYLNHQRWLIYDPAKSRPIIISERELLTLITNQVQIYTSLVPLKNKKVFHFPWKTFWTLIKQNFLHILLVNLLTLVSLLMTIIFSSFLRILFQEYLFLTRSRVMLLGLALTIIVFLNWTLNYLIKILNYFFANHCFLKILQKTNFDHQFFLATKYLFPSDLEQSYFQFQANLVNGFFFLNEVFGSFIFSIFVGLYFFKVNPWLFLSSILLLLGLLGIKLIKLKSLLKHQTKRVEVQKLYVWEFRLLVKNSQAIYQKTTLDNYLGLKNINQLLSFQEPKSNDWFIFLERFFICLYYLILCWLLPWSNKTISSLIIFTSITLALNNQLEHLCYAVFQIDWNNYFNKLNKINHSLKMKSQNLKVTFGSKVLEKNFIIISQKLMPEVLINNKSIMSFSEEIYFANDALNFDDNLYHNIFNYQEINLTIFQKANLGQIIKDYHLSLDQTLEENDQEIVKYLSCFFVWQKIVVLNLPTDDSLIFRLVDIFPEKIFIFLNEAS